MRSLPKVFAALVFVALLPTAQAFSSNQSGPSNMTPDRTPVSAQKLHRLAQITPQMQACARECERRYLSCLDTKRKDCGERRAACRAGCGF
jgi:hypothetical protein